MQNNNLVSVILPTYNWNAVWLSEALDSVLNQTYSELEIIIVNDWSTNNVEDTIFRYLDGDIRIRYLRNEKNMERSYSKNRGILESKWQYIAFIDDDDIRNDSDKLKKQIDFLRNNLTYWLCGTSVSIIEEWWNINNFLPMRETNEQIKEHLLQFNQIAQSSVVIRKDIFAQSWLFNTRYIPSEDAELRLRVGKYCKLYNLQTTSITYRDRVWNSSNQQAINQQWQGFKAMCQHHKYYPYLFKSIILRIWLMCMTFLWIKYNK